VPLLAGKPSPAMPDSSRVGVSERVWKMLGGFESSYMFRGYLALPNFSKDKLSNPVRSYCLTGRIASIEAVTQGYTLPQKRRLAT